MFLSLPNTECYIAQGCALDPALCASRITELLEQVDMGQQVVATDPIHIVEDVTVPRRDSSITAWVNVIYGCNERCTYCVVPNTRGQEQSREPDAIMVCRRVTLQLAVSYGGNSVVGACAVK